MGYLTNAMGLFSDVETVTGTTSDPLDKANAFADPVKQDVRVRELSISVDVAKDDENSKYLTGDFTGDESIIGMTTSTIDLSIKFAPGQVTSGASDYSHDLKYGKYLDSCGLKEVQVFDDVVTSAAYQYGIKHLYYPTIAQYEETMTIDVVERDPGAGKDGIAYESIGCYGDMSLAADTVGAPVTMSFNFMGGLEDVYEVPAVAIPNLAFDDDGVMKTVADKFLNTTFKITDLETDVELAGVCVSTLTFAQGNQRTLRDCSSSESGVKAYANTGMQPRLSFSPELTSLSDWDYYKALTEERFYKIEITSKYKSADGDEALQIFIPKAQLINSNITDDENFRRNELEWRPLRNVDKEYPVVTYQDSTTGADIIWDGAEMTDAQKAEAMYYIVFSEVPVGYIPLP